MSTVRQDAWNSDEDLILAEVVLRHIREGSTQLAAFEEVGERLQRTSAACGFRWNSTIRKKYDAAIALAKKQRKKATSVSEEENIEIQRDVEEIELAEENDAQEVNTHYIEEIKIDQKENLQALTLCDVISFLQQLERNTLKDQEINHENKRLSIENKELQGKNKELEKAIEQIKKEKEIIQEDYRLLINIMERARKMAVINEEITERIK